MLTSLGEGNRFANCMQLLKARSESGYGFCRPLMKTGEKMASLVQNRVKNQEPEEYPLGFDISIPFSSPFCPLGDVCHHSMDRQ